MRFRPDRSGQSPLNRLMPVVWEVLASSISGLVLKGAWTLAFFLLSVFTYSTFYSVYMPSLSAISKLPINLAFQPCLGETTSRCSYPSTSVFIDRKHWPLIQGQTYEISVSLTIPDSPITEQVGMFMSCVNVTSPENELVGRSCMSAVPEYRSPVLRLMETLTLGLPLLTGWSSQQQQLSVTYFSHFKPDPRRPAEKIYIEVQSTMLHIKSAFLHVESSVSGLRYVLQRHPWFSAICGVSLIFSLFSGIYVLSYANLHQNSIESLGKSRTRSQTSSQSSLSSSDDNLTDVEDGNSDPDKGCRGLGVENVEEMNPTEVLEEIEDTDVPLRSFIETTFNSASETMHSLREEVKAFSVNALPLLRKMSAYCFRLMLFIVLVTCSYEIIMLGGGSPWLVFLATLDDIKFAVTCFKDALFHIFSM